MVSVPIYFLRFPHEIYIVKLVCAFWRGAFKETSLHFIIWLWGFCEDYFVNLQQICFHRINYTKDYWLGRNKKKKKYCQYFTQKIKQRSQFWWKLAFCFRFFWGCEITRCNYPLENMTFICQIVLKNPGFIFHVDIFWCYSMNKTQDFFSPQKVAFGMCRLRDW